MSTLKPISKDSVRAALDKAHLLRTMSEPQVAASICWDVLEVEPENQEALVRLILALSDQFEDERTTIQQVLRVLPRLDSEYERWYYSGIAFERWAKSQHRKGLPGMVAADWYREALAAFEKAEATRPPGNDDSILRWNACVRIIRADEHLKTRFSNLSFGVGLGLGD